MRFGIALSAIAILCSLISSVTFYVAIWQRSGEMLALSATFAALAVVYYVLAARRLR